MLEIVSAASAPGRPDRANEDGYGVSGRFAWVIDGATGLGDEQLLDAPSDAAWLTAAMNAAFCAHAAAAAGPAELLAIAAQECERRFLAERRRAPLEPYEVPTAAVVLAHFSGSGSGIEIVELGDCALYVSADGAIDRFGGTEAGRALEKKNARNMMAGGGGRSPDVLAFLRRVRNRANTPGGYAIFAPDAASCANARRHHHPAPAGEALLLTDGFEAAIDDYGLFSEAGLLAAVRAGVDKPLAAVRELEDSDPDCRRFPRFKKSDDATAMLVRFAAVQ